jgi:secreted trypsin-like serine protease
MAGLSKLVTRYVYAARHQIQSSEEPYTTLPSLLLTTMRNEGLMDRIKKECSRHLHLINE